MAAPYDTIETILNAARVRLNDAIQALSGDVLTNAQPFTTQIVNNAWRTFQRKLASYGYWTLEAETIITGLPAVYSTDPGLQVYINWNGYNNGNADYPSLVLPQNLIEPLDCWERVATTMDPFDEMDLVMGSLPLIPKGQVNQLWCWREDALFMPGSLTDMDLRVRYASYFGDFFAISTPTTGPAQVVPIMQCLDPFANYICAEAAKGRGDVDGDKFSALADQGAAMIAARNGSANRSTYKASEMGKMRDAYTPDGA